MTHSLSETFDRFLTGTGLFAMLAAVPLAGVMTVINSLPV